jgi:hypothetical protein
VSTRLAALALALLLAAGLAGCGLGAGERGVEARVLVTRDYGGGELGARIFQDLPESETVMRLLQRGFDVETRFGGGFVQSIEGIEGGREDGRPVDWFFYVNGMWSDEGAAEVQLHDGDRVWWDRHDWAASPELFAVVGSYPEPFLHGAEGRRYPVVLECGDEVEAACETVAERLGADGARPSRQAPGTGTGAETLRVVVGTWAQLRGDPALALLDRGPAASGVFARFDETGRTLALLDARGRTRRTLRAGAGLVAATRLEQQAPTWMVTGTDAAGVETAAAALDEQRLSRRFALAVGPSGDLALPLGE